MSNSDWDQIERDKWLKQAKRLWEESGGYAPRLWLIGLNLAAAWWLPPPWVSLVLWVLYWGNVFWVAYAHGGLVAVIMFAPLVAMSSAEMSFVPSANPWGTMLYVWIVTVALLAPPIWMVDEEWAWRMKKKFR